jgi:modulator of FtsH protease
MNDFNNQASMYSPSGDSRVVQQVLRRTYLLLAISLIPTAIGGLIGVNVFVRPSMMSFIITLVVMYGLMFMVMRNKNSFAGVAWLMVFTLFMGILLGPLLQMTLKVSNGGSIILFVALLTSVIFFAMSAIGATIKRELTGLGNFLTVGSIVLIIAILANIFLRLPVLQLAISGIFVIFSSLMILWQINNIVRGGENNYISATLVLYISIYNLFTSLLMIFSGGGRR